MSKINCLIVDDEELARTLLENYLLRLPDLNLVEKCSNPLEARMVLEENSVDLLFLDIQMPEISGLEFLKTLTNQPLVIFTTAYDNYALEGYALNIVDYLLKPFSFERFLQAVNKAKDLLQYKHITKQLYQKEKDATFKSDYVLIKAEHKVHRILYRNIIYIQSMREYVAFHLPDKRVLSLGSLKKLEQKLPTTLFIRIHKSYIVAKEKVTVLEGNMLHVGQHKLPIGASFRAEVLEALF